MSDRPVYVYEDDLPESITDEEYNVWFKLSKIVNGVRVGPSLSDVRTLIRLHDAFEGDTGFSGVENVEQKELDMANRTLYEIGDDLRALEDLLLDQDGEIADEDQESVIDAWFAEIETNLKEKVDNYAGLIKDWQGHAALMKEESARMSARAKVFANGAERLKHRLQVFIDTQRNGEKIVGDKFTVRTQANSAAPVIVHCMPDELPEQFQHIEVTADKTELARWLKDNGDLEIGGRKLAEIGEPGRHLRIA